MEDMPAATIVFTAHNRRDLLLEAVRLAERQTVPVEIIVMDDFSTDGTAEAMAEHFPTIRYIRSALPKGPCYQRNRGVELATCEIVFPLDDDSLLVSSKTVEQTLAQFADAEVALIAVPFQNILQDQTVHQRRVDLSRRETGFAFVACAHALRKTAFLAIGGYEESYFYMGEEGDLAIRLLQYGIATDLGSADPIHHMQPANRKSERANFYGRRNDLLFYYLRCPATMLPGRLIGTTIKGVIFGWRHQCLNSTIKGLFAGWRLIGTAKLPRSPVSRATFTKFIRLKQGRR